MIPSVVINLDDQPLRWDHIKRQFARVGLSEPRRLAAHTGHQVPHGWAKWSVEDCLSDGWTRGEVGCLLSHISALRLLEEEGLPVLAVFEDDVILGADFKAVFEALSLPAAPTIIKLESWFHPTVIAPKPTQQITGRTALHRLLGDHKGAAAYVLNAAAARVLTRRLSEAPSPADVLTFSPRRLRCEITILQVAPAAVMQQVFLPDGRRDDKLKSVLVDERWTKELSRRRPLAERILGRGIRTVEALRLRLLARSAPALVPFLDPEGELFLPLDA